MLPEQLRLSINQQVVNELSASNAYLAVAGYMDAQDLKVLSAFYFQQAGEERDHALRLYKFLLEVDEKVVLGAIPQARGDFKSPLEAVEYALALEEKTTAQIDELMTLAKSLNAHSTVSFLKWFVDEQVEEIATAKELVGLVRRAGDQHLLLVEDRLIKKGISPEAPAVEPE